MATKSKGKGKFTETETAKHIKKIQEETEKYKGSVKKGDNFIAPTEEQLREKLQRVNSPFFTFESWGNAAPGGTVNYNVGIYNPDPVLQVWMFAHVFVGSGNVVSDTGRFLLNVDARFPRLTQPNFAGLNLAAGASATLSYSIKIPSTIEPSNYMGNTILFRANWFDPGTEYDRALFVFRVT